MNDTIRLATDLGLALQQHRKAGHLSVTALAQRAGKARDVIYRLERGDEASVSSLMAVLNAMGLVLRIEKAGLPTLQEIQARFAEEDDDAA
jgi:transcriptional regulator with XRE-family HTH domain